MPLQDHRCPRNPNFKVFQTEFFEGRTLLSKLSQGMSYLDFSPMKLLKKVPYWLVPEPRYQRTSDSTDQTERPAKDHLFDSSTS